MAEIAGKTAFVFTGGGSLSAIQVGMLKSVGERSVIRPVNRAFCNIPLIPFDAE